MTEPFRTAPQQITAGQPIGAAMLLDIISEARSAMLEAAVDLAEAIYKKLPRYRRQIDFDITTPDAPKIERYGMTVLGAGTLIEEISEKYL